jgi:septal ring factor EnvC (AmiA/AmiB activator)
MIQCAMLRRLPLALLLAAALPAAAADSGRRVEAVRRELVQHAEAEVQSTKEAESQRARLEAINAQETALKARIDANAASLSRMLSALQMYQRNPPPALLVSPRSARDAVRAAILIRALTPALEARGKSFAAEAHRLAELRRNAATASEALFQSESEIADRRARIDDLLTEKAGLEGPSPVDPALAQAARSGGMDELARALPGRAGPATGGPPEHMLWPVRGEPLKRAGRRGWTWKAEGGSTVLAPAAARVDYAGPLKGWGEVVILGVGGGHHLVLAGLARADVGAGRPVAQGEPVGRMAEAARGSKGQPELYMEMRRGSDPVDPSRWFGQAAPKG